MTNRDLTSFEHRHARAGPVLQGLMPGDNVVWEVDASRITCPFLSPFWEERARQNRKLVYFRFARHPALLQDDCGAARSTGSTARRASSGS